MAWHLAAVVLAAVMAFAPLALVACETLCAGESHGAQHSCHRATSADVPVLSGGVHACGHEDALPAAAKDLVVPPPAALVAIVGIVHDIRCLDIPRTAFAATPSPPGSSTPLVPLRI